MRRRWRGQYLNVNAELKKLLDVIEHPELNSDDPRLPAMRSALTR